MAFLGTLSVSGQNGSTYDFKVYPLGTTFDPVSAVYLITKRTPEFGNGGFHTYIYIGETNDLKQMCPVLYRTLALLIKELKDET